MFAKPLTFFYHHTSNTVSVYTTPQNLNATWIDTKTILPTLWYPCTQLCIATDEKPYTPFDFPKPKFFYKVQLLKSALQKSIRRGLQATAVRLAWQLMCQDLNSFLRRLPLIIMEDSCLHPRFPHIIWLMIAYSKHRKLSKEDVEMLLSVVEDVANCDYRDLIPHHKNVNQFVNPLLLKERPKCTDEILPFVAAIILRVNYGGTLGDQEWMKKFAMLWYQRYEMNAKLWNEARSKWYRGESKFGKKLIEQPPVLLPADKLQIAIDFHVFPFLLQKMIDLYKMRMHKSISEDLLRATIWFHRSGINLKKPICTRDDPYTLQESEKDNHEEQAKKETLQIWNEIKDTWEEICKSKDFWRPVEEVQNKKRKRKETKKEESTKITNFFPILKKTKR